MSVNNDTEYFMNKAYKNAEKAYRLGEVPVGAVIVKGGQVISCGYNKRESKKNALCHAEIIAISRACRRLGGWRLHECDMYITLEPCPMCAGAIINARIKNVYIGAMDSKSGAFGSICNLSEMGFNHKPYIINGICEDKCSDLLSRFFFDLRQKNKQKSEK